MKVKVLAPIDVTTKNDLMQSVVTTHMPGAVLEMEDERAALLIESGAVEAVKEAARPKKDKAGEGE